MLCALSVFPPVALCCPNGLEKKNALRCSLVHETEGESWHTLCENKGYDLGAGGDLGLGSSGRVGRVAAAPPWVWCEVLPAFKVACLWAAVKNGQCRPSALESSHMGLKFIQFLRNCINFNYSC